MEGLEKSGRRSSIPEHPVSKGKAGRDRKRHGDSDIREDDGEVDQRQPRRVSIPFMESGERLGQGRRSSQFEYQFGKFDGA